MIRGSVVKYSLRLRMIGTRMDALSRFQIDHLKRVVVHGRHKKPLLPDVNTQMIDAPTYVW